MIALWHFLVRQKFRFDLGFSVLSIINLVILTIAAGDKITTFLHLETRYLLLAICPAAVSAVWLTGYLLDRLRYSQRIQTESNTRSEEIQRILEQLERIEQKLNHHRR